MVYIGPLIVGERGPVSEPKVYPAPTIRIHIGRLGFRTKRDRDVRAYEQLRGRFWLRRSDYSASDEWKKDFGGQVVDSSVAKEVLGFFEEGGSDLYATRVMPDEEE